MKWKLFEQRGKNSFKLVIENSFSIDRIGSLPHRPEAVRFKKSDDYNDHMGFDAALPDGVMVTPEQEKTVKELMKQGYKITGHAKMPDDTNKIEIQMTLRTKTGSRYADIQPSGLLAK